MDENAYKERWFMSIYILDKTEMNSKRMRSVMSESKKLKLRNAFKKDSEVEKSEELKKCCVVLLDS